MGLPATFADFQSLQCAAGSLDNIIHATSLVSANSATPEAKLMAHLYGDGFVAKGYHAAPVHHTLFPWVDSGCTDATSVLRMYGRLRECCRVLKEVWHDVGWGHLLSTPLPDNW